MALLALETSLVVCGVSVLTTEADTRILYARDEQLYRTHSTKLLPMVEEALVESGVPRQEFRAIGVSVGPGSFTGIRIGLATAKALARAWAVPLVAPNTLEVIAANVVSPDICCVVLDARRGMYYSGVYRHHGAGRMQTLWEAGAYNLPEIERAVLGFAQTLEPGARLVLAGDAISQVEAAMHKIRPNVVYAEASECVPSSTNLGLIALCRYRQSLFCDPEEVTPVYLRRSEAEEKRARGVGVDS